MEFVRAANLGVFSSTFRAPHSPKFIGGQFAELVELDLLREHVQRHRGRPPQPATTLVIVQYGVERRPVPVEEVLVA